MSVKEFFKECLKAFFKGFFRFDLKTIMSIFTLIFIFPFINFFFIKKCLLLEFDFFTYFVDHISCKIHFLEVRKELQQILVGDLLRMMQWNELCFYVNPNSIEFAESKILYQFKLKIFLDKLNLDVFEDPNLALKCITEFYDHYLKIIELNNDLINNKKL